MRETLLAKYRNRWIAFAARTVVASGTSRVEVFHAAKESGQHPFVTCVAREHEPSRMRRAIATLVFSDWLHLDGNNYRCRLQADFTCDERSLDRHVLNRITVLFNGLAAEVVINP